MGWGKRIGVAALLLGLVAAVPIARNETTCMRPRAADAAPYQPLLPPESRRNGVDTFLTYPEWSIVHAYEDLAGVTRQRGEEHFGYWRAIRSYWSSLCSLSRIASSRGEIALDMKAMLYIIGVSFSGEMAVKGLYETSIGRLTAWLRGPERVRRTIATPSRLRRNTPPSCARRPGTSIRSGPPSRPTGRRPAVRHPPSPERSSGASRCRSNGA